MPPIATMLAATIILDANRTILAKFSLSCSRRPALLERRRDKLPLAKRRVNIHCSVNEFLSTGKGEVEIMKEHADQPRRRRRVRRLLWTLPAVGILAVAASCSGVVKQVASLSGSPDQPFDLKAAPPAPDYARADTWLAFPGRNGLERSTPPGMNAIDEGAAPVDVFFVHPTTLSGSAVWNAAYDAPVQSAKLEPAVLMDQLSVFNGCCRLYAPHYRQASLAGLKDRGANALAYSDVARAFRYFIAHHSKGRPFIIASHSQGSGHATELLQREIVGTPLQQRMVAAYLIGGYVPRSFAQIGLPTCDSPRQTGCVISYNASKGWKPARMVIEGKSYWWQGEWKQQGDPQAICVNPLTWRADGPAAAPEANLGSLAFPQEPFPQRAVRLTALEPRLTGAMCKDQMLEVDLPSSTPKGFSDTLSSLFGSYHLNDYGLFYANLRQNAMDRVAAWQAAHPERK
jgi:hypothetical protein